ncbi:MAG: ABC transporter permease [Chloroflexi bacterium]|nr:ABC transporter permease [Chloroflexota bacterium]
MRNKIWIVFQKELVDNLRDRRTITSALFSAVFTPMLLMGVFVVLGQTTADRAERLLTLPVSGAENAPALIQFLRQNNVQPGPPPVDPQADVRAGNNDVVLVIPPGFAEDFSAGRPATVQLVFDDSRTAAGVTVRRVRGLLDGYSRQIGALRLLARGISPAVTTALAIEEVDISTPQSQAASFLNITPYILVLVVFTGGLSIITDITAGERERGSLEPLLINPVPRRDFVLAKLWVTMAFTATMVTVTLAALALALNLAPFEKYFGVRISLNLASLVAIWLITVPMVVFAAALQMVISVRSRSVKEAQTILSLMAIFPGLPGLFLAFVPVKSTPAAMLIPTFGQQLLINQLMRGEAVAPLHVAASVLATLGLGAALVLVAIRLYQREQVLFGR